MKKIKKSIQFGLIVLSLIFIGSLKAQTISNHFFGQNAWMPDTIGNVHYNGKLHKQWGNIKKSGATMIRYGGIGTDQNMPTHYQYLRIIDSIRANGMEPTIQVPFNNFMYTAQQAADIVRFINITSGRNIKYWIIGNEPNLGYNYTTSAQIAAYIKPFASAMKNVDPSILIVGPETASFKQAMIDGLTTPNGPDDITGKDAAGRYYVDVISFHTYPMQNGTFTRAQCIGKLTASGSFSDNLDHLNTRISAANAAHGRTGASALKTAITETNINYNNAATDNLYGVGANSFFGGQFVDEIYGIGLTKGVDFINLWSVMEGGSNVVNNGGYLDGSTGAKKPLYYHFQLMAENFKGNSIIATSNQPTVKTFACKNGSETTVLILNEDLTNNYNYTIRLNTGAIAGTDPLKINVNAGIAFEYNNVIPNQSTLLLTFNDLGELIKKIEYSLSGQAVAGLPPTVTLYNPTTTICNLPVGLNATLITSATATLNWLTTGAASYNVRYKATASATWTTINVSALSKSITGLTAATAYEFQVAAVCSSTSSSAFSASTLFNTTAGVCNIPAGLNTDSITASGATLNWLTTGAISYNVRYKATTSTTWTTINVSALSKSITGLTVATAYEFQVASICSGTSSSAFSASTLFSTEISTGITESINQILDLNMNLYPNPTTSDINISFNISKGEMAKVTIYNILGDLVLQTNYNAESTGRQLIVLDFKSDSKLLLLTSGTYMCCLDARGKRTFEKFILVR